MKKLLSTLMVIACLALAIPAQAQIKFGVKAGLNVSKLHLSEETFSSDNRAGFFVGPTAEFTLPLLGLGVDASALYNQFGVDSEEGTSTKKSIDLKSATTRLYDTEAKIICIVSKKGAQCIECHHKDI